MMNKRTLIGILLAVLLAALFVGTVSATAPTEVAGTYTFDYFNPIWRSAGDNCLIEVDGEYPFSGDLVGTAYTHFWAISHGPCPAAPFENRENLYGRGTFVGSVLDSDPGTFDFVYEGRAWPADPGEQAVTAHIVVLSGTDGLENLHGRLDVTYIMGQSFDDYTGEMHFDP